MQSDLTLDTEMLELAIDEMTPMKGDGSVPWTRRREILIERQKRTIAYVRSEYGEDAIEVLGQTKCTLPYLRDTPESKGGRFIRVTTPCRVRSDVPWEDLPERMPIRGSE